MTIRKEIKKFTENAKKINRNDVKKIVLEFIFAAIILEIPFDHIATEREMGIYRPLSHYIIWYVALCILNIVLMTGYIIYKKGKE